MAGNAAAHSTFSSRTFTGHGLGRSAIGLAVRTYVCGAVVNASRRGSRESLQRHDSNDREVRCPCSITF